MTSNLLGSSLLGSPKKLVNVDADKLRGMLLGLAIGDALGNTSESKLPEKRFELYGEVRDYLPNKRAKHEPVGTPSDDTQMAFWTIEHLLEHRRLIPDELAKKFADKKIIGIGRTVRQFQRNWKPGQPWQQSSVPSAGNGALMRIAPVLLPHLKNPSPQLWDDAAVAAAVTHNDPAAISSSVAFIAILWDLLDRKEAPSSRWWCEKYVEVANPIEGDAVYTPRGGAFMGWSGPVCKFVEEHVPKSLDDGLSVLDAANSWFSAAFLLETVPTVLFILARFSQDPEEAIVRAVNDTKDNDTVAAIVGAAVGAIHGASVFPKPWMEGLTGRVYGKDDGAVQKLTEMAIEAFL